MKTEKKTNMEGPVCYLFFRHLHLGTSFKAALEAL